MSDQGAITAANAAQRLPGRWLTVWLMHTGALEDGPVHVDDGLLAAAIRENPVIPPELVGLVTGRVDGSDRRPRGRPKETPGKRSARLLRDDLFLRREVDLQHAAFRLLGVSQARERAVEVVAKERHMSPATLRNRLIEARRELPALPSVRLIALEGDGREREPSGLEGLIQAAVDAGLAVLDPTFGLHWTDSTGTSAQEKQE